MARSRRHRAIVRLSVNLVVTLSLALAACGEEPQHGQAQRIALDAVQQAGEQPLRSPVTTDAAWRVDANGNTIRFGTTEDAPMLSLACDLSARPQAITLIRHVPSKPGQSALFPVIGNGRISRFLADAKLNEGEWRWEATLTAADEQLDVFAGSRDVEATLPGGGTLVIAGSTIPAQFLAWCRAGGKGTDAAADATAPVDAGVATSAPPVR